MRVLVTGGAGFLGSHICEHFTNQKWEVIAFDNFTKHELKRTPYQADGCRDYISGLLDGWGVEVIKGDIVHDPDILNLAMKGCDLIVHTAAQPAITISWEDPCLDFRTNVIGTFNVLEFARLHKLPVVSCATIHVYGNDRVNADLESDKFRYKRKISSISELERIADGIMTPLHASKIAGDTYVRAYADSF